MSEPRPLEDGQGRPDPKLVDRANLAAELRSRIARSVTSAARGGDTVKDPMDAAGYVLNMLLVHEPKLLARLAVTFARTEVEEELANE